MRNAFAIALLVALTGVTGCGDVTSLAFTSGLGVVEELELCDADALREIDAAAVAAVEAAVAFAESSDPPDPREVTTDVYVSYPESS